MGMGTGLLSSRQDPPGVLLRDPRRVGPGVGGRGAPKLRRWRSPSPSRGNRRIPWCILGQCRHYTSPGGTRIHSTLPRDHGGPRTHVVPPRKRPPPVSSRRPRPPGEEKGMTGGGRGRVTGGSGRDKRSECVGKNLSGRPPLK